MQDKTIINYDSKFKDKEQSPANNFKAKHNSALYL